MAGADLAVWGTQWEGTPWEVSVAVRMGRGSRPLLLSVQQPGQCGGPVGCPATVSPFATRRSPPLLSSVSGLESVRGQHFKLGYYTE